MSTLNRREKVHAVNAVKRCVTCGLTAGFIMTATCIGYESSLLIAYGQEVVTETSGVAQGAEILDTEETIACNVETVPALEVSNVIEANVTETEGPGAEGPGAETSEEEVSQTPPGAYELSENNAVEFEYVEPTPSLMEKYSYALYDTGGRKNDIDENLLQVLEESCNQWGVNPHLMLGVIMTESEGHANAKNSRSTATGLCQILRGTGKYIYEDLMGNGRGTYNHSMAYDPATNIRMGCAYMGTLIRQRGSVYRAIQTYRGKTNVSGYVGKINRYMGNVGLSVNSL